VEIKLSIEISRPVEKVFDFLRDFENHHQEKNSQVLMVEKLTSGLLGIGSQYQETVQMLPFAKSIFVTEFSRSVPPKYLQFSWSGGGMEGMLEYNLQSVGDQTRLNFRELIQPKGILKFAGPIIQSSFRKTMVDRLDGIKRILEEGVEEWSE
jgi:carbon monoxide dehydrogenase subunit G